MRSPVRKRSVKLQDRHTSVTLEDEFWSGLGAIAADEETSIAAIIATLAAEPHGNLSSTLRVYVLQYYQQKAKEHFRIG